MATRFARNTVFSTIAGLCYSIGAFLTSIIIARVLGVDGAGVVALAIWIVTLTVALTDVGVFSSLTRFLPELTDGGDRQPAVQLASFLLRLFFLLSLLPFFFYALLALWPRLAPLSRSIFGQGEHSVLWILVGLGCITQALATFMQGYWRGMQQFDRSAYVLMVSVSFQLVTVTAGSILFGIPGALAGIFCGSILPALFCLTVSWREPPISCELRNRVVRYAVYCWSGSLASTFVWSRVELAFLNHYFGSEPVGLFSVGLTLSTMATQGPMLLTGGLLVFLSEHFGKKNFQAIQDTAATGTRIFAFMVLPLCFGMAAILPELLPLIYGPSFRAAVPAATVLVASAGVAACAAVASNVVLAHERSDLFALSGLVGVVLALLLGFVIIPYFGIMGAAWGRAFVQLVMVVIGFWFVERRLNCPMPYKHLALLVAAAALCAGAARAVLVVIPGMPGLFLSITMGALVYFAAVRLFHALPQEDIDRLHSLISPLFDRFRRTIQTTWRRLRPS
jgi:O-antigen/teichoic acid export membrane protein